MSEIAVGSRIRKSPFYNSTIASGAAKFTIYNHMYMPTSFGDPAAEYERLTTGVALWDVSAERQVEVKGPDAFALVQYLSARDMAGCRPGRARYAPMCDHQGRLINDPVILCLAEDRYWISIADSDILLWARAIAGERGDAVKVFEPDVSPLAIQGPKARALVGDLFGADLVKGLGFFHHTPVELDGIPMTLCRSGWSKQGGYELFLTNGSEGNRLWDLVMAAGAAYGIGPGSPNHVERLESGLLSYASDTDPETDPIEAGLGAFVSDVEGHNFVGKAALAKRASAIGEDAQRTLVNVVLSDEAPRCEHPWLAFVNGVEVGRVHNATYSRRLGKTVGLALLAPEAAAPGTTLEVDATTVTETIKVQAVVSDVPFGDIQ